MKNRTSILLLSGAFLLSGALIGCDKKDGEDGATPPAAPTQSGGAVGDAVSKAKADVLKMYDSYVSNTEEALEQLKKGAGAMGDSAKEKLAPVEKELSEFKSALSAAKAETGDIADETKAKLEDAKKRVEAALEKAKKELSDVGGAVGNLIGR